MEIWLHGAINQINAILWNYLLIALLLAAGAFFTLRFKLVQIRAFAHSVRLLSHRAGEGITPFQAFSIGVASRVGTGNITGVAIALTVGGPGAIFWMWITALLGMSSAFVEATLAQIFKLSNGDSTFRGGPAYYIAAGLKSRWLALLFSLSLILAFGFVFNAVQANSIADAFHHSFGWSQRTTGIGLVLITAPIIFGGIRRVSRVSQVVVPIMAIAYLLLALYVVVTHMSMLPEVFRMIFGGAFGLEPVAGGLAGFAVKQALIVGIKRGLFSNEAGMGSAPNAAAAATTRHPVTQGLLQMLGVFVDTLVICSATALLILVSGQYDPSVSIEGAALTQRAVESAIGPWGSVFMALAIFLFAQSSIIGNYAYAESNVQFICRKPALLRVFRLGVLGMVMFGSVGSLPLVWDMADTSMGLMAVINLIAILLLNKYALAAWRDYLAQRRQGIRVPVFSRSSIAGLDALIAPGVWEESPNDDVNQRA